MKNNSNIETHGKQRIKMFEPIKLVGYQFVSTFLFGVYKFYFSLIDHRLQSSIFKYNKKKNLLMELLAWW